MWIFLKQFCLKGSEAPESSETSESNIAMSSVPITEHLDRSIVDLKAILDSDFVYAAAF